AWFSRLFENHRWEFPWYQFLHRYFFWRGVSRGMPDRDGWRRLTSGTPILMYHAFARDGEPASRYLMPRWRFALQMACLNLTRYRVLGLDHSLGYRRPHHLPPARSVVISIDDGSADVRSEAYPILRRHCFPASVFIVTRHVGGANRWDQDRPLAT